MWILLPRSPVHPYVILPCTFRQRKWAEVSPESVVLHSRATKMRDSVAQACRAALSGDENARKCHPSVPYFTLGRRKVYGFRCRRVPFILTSFCPTPTGNKNGRKCRLKVSYCTLGRRKCATVLPKRVVLHSRATKSMGFVAEESPLILTSFCPTPTGNQNGRKCCLKVSCCTLGRRKCSEVSPKRAVLYSRATESVGFVAEESHSSLRHSALHLSATKMG